MSDPRQARWRETRAMLNDLMTWLDQTQQWVKSTASETEPIAPQTEDVEVAEIEAPQPDLFALLAEMTALRQEVKIQTRSARHDREQAAQALEQLSAALAEMERDQPAESDHVAVEALVDLHDALSRADRQGSRLVIDTVATLRGWSMQSELQEAPAAPPQTTESAESDSAASTPTTGRRRRGWFRHRRTQSIPTDPEPPSPELPPRDIEQVETLRQIGREAEQIADRLEGLSTGYTLGVQRLERMLAAHGIEPVDCVGQPVDVNLMEVVQLVSNPSHPPGVVVDEVRRGYRRHGQVYRFAQVVATRVPPAEGAEPPVDDAPHGTSPIDPSKDGET